MAFCFTFILDEDLSAPSDRDGETFISLDGRDAVSGPYKDSTPATLRRVQIVSSSLLTACPRAISVESRLWSRFNVLLQILRLFRYFRRSQYDFDTFPLRSRSPGIFGELDPP